MGQKVNPHGLRVGVIKDWDSRWFARDDLQLLGDGLGHQLGVLIGLLDLHHVDVDGDLLAPPPCRPSAPTSTTASPKPPPSTAASASRCGSTPARCSRTRNLTEKEVANNASGETWVLMPLAPKRMALPMAFFMARRKETRPSSCWAMDSATSWAFLSGCFTSTTLTVTARRCSLPLLTIFSQVWRPEGPTPLQTLRADIDYGFAEAATQYGRIGVKVWIYAGE